MKYDRNKNHCGQNNTPNQLYLNLTELPAYLSHDLDPRVVILVYVEKRQIRNINHGNMHYVIDFTPNAMKTDSLAQAMSDAIWPFFFNF